MLTNSVNFSSTKSSAYARRKRIRQRFLSPLLAIFLHVGACGGRSASDVMLNAKPGGGPWKPSWCDSRSFDSRSLHLGPATPTTAALRTHTHRVPQLPALCTVPPLFRILHPFGVRSPAKTVSQLPHASRRKLNPPPAPRFAMLILRPRNAEPAELWCTSDEAAATGASGLWYRCVD